MNTGMPKYICHKEVGAFKILGIKEPNLEGNWVIIPAGDRGLPFYVGSDYVQVHKPEEGGYYMLYKDGYETYLSAEDFENAHTLINPEDGHE